MQIIVTVCSDGAKEQTLSCASVQAKQLLKLSSLKQAYGDTALLHTQVFEWYARFWDDCENLEGCSG
jgi:hypothetical protein